MTTMVEETVSVQTVLNKIADDIQQRGHYQGAEDENGEVCIVTAPAYRHRALGRPLGEMVLVEICKRIGAREFAWYRVYDWNDNTPTDEVLRVLRGEVDG